MNYITISYILAINMLPLLLTNCVFAKPFADVIYTNGTIITINEKQKFSEAVAIKNNNIIAVGSKKYIKTYQSTHTKIINLHKKTLLPGFIDAHGHFYYTSEYEYNWIDLNSQPIGKVKTVDDIVSILKQKAKTVPEGEWILGWGYDHTNLAGGKHPTAADLDKVSTKHPIFIQHSTGWFSVANTLAMKMAHIYNNPPELKNGKILIDPITKKPTGVIASAQSPVYDIIPKHTKDELIQAILKGSELYLKAGVTTAQEAWGYFNQWNLLKQALAANALKLRVIFIPLSQGNAAKNLHKFPNIPAGTAIDSNKMLMLGGRKLTADGTIKGKSYLTTPYSYLPDENKNYRGNPSHTYADLEKLVVKFHKKGQQLVIHANGDAAIDDALKAIAVAQQRYPRKEARHVILHAQLARPDQLTKMNKLHITPSFFSSSIYYHGDIFYRMYGKKRAINMNPAGDALRTGLLFSLHSDTYVTPMQPLRMIQSAVDRKSWRGKKLGKQAQGIPVYEAIKAVTLNAAWQNNEDKIKGSIEVGKLADFVILNENPLLVDPDKISQIKILATIVGGKLAWGQLPN